MINFIKIILLMQQVLDNEFSDDNRRRCAEAAKPLITAVDELTTFASSPEFASIPAKISHHVSQPKGLQIFWVNECIIVRLELCGSLCQNNIQKIRSFFHQGLFEAGWFYVLRVILRIFFPESWHCPKRVSRRRLKYKHKHLKIG